MQRLRIDITGVVQGVGFRPHVWRLARRLGLSGFVRNSAAGVEVEVEGPRAEEFLPELRRAPPPLARILTSVVRPIPARGDGEFAILASREEGHAAEVSADVATCEDCRRETLDPADRRYLYPFTNCTNCGPRYSITRAVPYDRPHTTMAPFRMCAACAREYADPADRRFHAQPNACPACGPRVEFRRGARRLRGRAAITAAVALLRRGGILALKGLGGFHLAADALNGKAVRLLRSRKRRSNKPFALMAPGVGTVREFCEVSPEEEALLRAPERPIVLLRRRPGHTLPEELAPSCAELGFMLPSTPLHWLLFFQPAGGAGRPGRGARPGADARLPEADAGGAHFRALVMTSGNLAEEPIVRDGAEAGAVLGPLVDAVLDHDREIFMRVDDSVVRRFDGRILFVRRARGYVPAAIPLPDDGPEVLACGAEVKNTFCLTTRTAAVVSQHVGDLENFETLSFFLETLENLRRVYRITPAALAHDLHPGYFSTRWALEQEGLVRWGVQHHWAHIGSVIAEHCLDGPVIGVALDGSGYGPDGTVWGGEFLVADARGFERRGRFRPVPMPGGEGAARQPWRMAVSYLLDACGGELPDRRGVGAEQIAAIRKVRGDRTLSPPTSGAGRLFEAVASLLGLRDVNTFEAEAAMALEAAAAPGTPPRYAFDLVPGEPHELEFSATLHELLDDAARGAPAAAAAARFHATVAAAIEAMVWRLHVDTRIRDVALSGGVFQNRLLLGLVTRSLAALGLRPLYNTLVPASDGGISLGQAHLLRAHLRG